jgi:hypothetical protein
MSDFKPFTETDPFPFKIQNTKMRENFADHGYLDTNGLLQKNNNIRNSTNYISDIKNYEITPLQEMSKDYINGLNEIDVKRNELSGNIDSYKQTRHRLEPEISKHEDEIITGKVKANLRDALIEDTNTMIVQQNYLYILGTLSFAIVLVGAIVIARN